MATEDAHQKTIIVQELKQSRCPVEPGIDSASPTTCRVPSDGRENVDDQSRPQGATVYRRRCAGNNWSSPATLSQHGRIKNTDSINRSAASIRQRRDPGLRTQRLAGRVRSCPRCNRCAPNDVCPPTCKNRNRRHRQHADHESFACRSSDSHLATGEAMRRSNVQRPLG